MTTKERLHKLIDQLPDDAPDTDRRLAAAEHALEANGTSGASERDETANKRTVNDWDSEWGEPEMLPLPKGWGWGRLPSGAPAPNWVAGLDEVRRGH